MNVGQNYGANPAPANPVVPTAQQAPQAAVQGQRTAIGSSPDFAFDLEIGLTTTHTKSPTEAYLLFSAVHAYREQRLKELREEYQFCREHPGKQPDFESVQRQLDDICRLSDIGQLLAYQIEHSYRQYYLAANLIR